MKVKAQKPESKTKLKKRGSTNHRATGFAEIDRLGLGCQEETWND